jgi:hypothetical protein
MQYAIGCMLGWTASPLVRLVSLVSSIMSDEPLGRVLSGLLGDSCWGAAAGAVDSCVRSFSVAAWEARGAAVAARALAGEPELVLIEPVVEQAVACVRVRGVVAAAPDPTVRICVDECHSRRQAAAMLQCPKCVRLVSPCLCWSVFGAGGLRLVLWCMSCCCTRLSGCFRGAHTPPATARGPMALALRLVQKISFFLSFFLSMHGSNGSFK